MDGQRNKEIRQGMGKTHGKKRRGFKKAKRGLQKIVKKTKSNIPRSRSCGSHSSGGKKFSWRPRSERLRLEGGGAPGSHEERLY